MHKVEFLVDSKYTVVENDGVFYYTDENQKRVILPRFDDYTWAGGIDDAPILIVRNKKRARLWHANTPFSDTDF